MNFREYFLKEETEDKPWLRDFDWAQDYVRPLDKQQSWSMRLDQKINTINGVTAQDLMRDYELLYAQFMEARLITNKPIRVDPKSESYYGFHNDWLKFYAIYGLPKDKPNDHRRMAYLQYATSVYSNNLALAQYGDSTVDVYRKDEDGYEMVDENETLGKIFGNDSTKYFELLRAFSLRDTKRRVEEIMNEFQKAYITAKIYQK